MQTAKMSVFREVTGIISRDKERSSINKEKLHIQIWNLDAPRAHTGWAGGCDQGQERLRVTSELDIPATSLRISGRQKTLTEDTV